MTALILQLVLLDLTALPPAPSGPRLVARAESRRSVRVRGSGFEPGERIDLMVDGAEPHASIACRGQRSERVKADSKGSFVTRIRISERDCALSCGTQTYVIWAKWMCGLDCEQALKNADPFTCSR